MFDVTTYGLEKDIESKVSDLLNGDNGANVTVKDIVALGVDNDTADKIFADFKNFIEQSEGSGTTSEDGGNETESESTQEEKEEQTVEEEATAEEEDTTTDGEDTASEDGATVEEDGDTTEENADTESGESDTGVESVDYESMYNDLKLKYEALILTNMISAAIAGIKFTSTFAKDGIIQKIKDKGLEVKDGELIGIADYLTELRSTYPDAFGDGRSNKPYFGKNRGTDADSGSDINKFLQNRYKNNPYFK
ncbi:MAG: hypothetical protein VZQ98_15955 [Bacteroidales bacterium]|nr:hypothetical protein [Bacteroidales bacterium]